MSITEFNTQIEQLPSNFYSLAFNLTKNQEDAEDLVQETAYRALLNRDKFTLNTNLKAWLYTIMKNIFINNYRRASNHQVVSNESNEQDVHYHNSTASNGGELRLCIKEICGAITAIDESIRIPFLLYFQGYKYQEIADHLNIPLGTVKSRIFFARKELQHRISGCL